MRLPLQSILPARWCVRLPPIGRRPATSRGFHKPPLPRLICSRSGLLRRDPHDNRNREGEGSARLRSATHLLAATATPPAFVPPNPCKGRRHPRRRSMRSQERLRPKSYSFIRCQCRWPIASASTIYTSSHSVAKQVPFNRSGDRLLRKGLAHISFAAAVCGRIGRLAPIPHPPSAPMTSG